MRDLNKILLIGRLGVDPVQRETKNGTAVTHFSLATSRKIPDESSQEEGAMKEETVWHKVVTWGRQAQVCAQYLKKGSTIYVEGSIRKHSFTGQDGSQRMAFEVHADSVGFLNGIVSGRSPEESVEAGGARYASTEESSAIAG